MFRNGIAVGRRPVLTKSLASIVVHSKRNEFPFVCTTCQVRAMASHSKPQRRRGVGAEDFASQIKRLEAHVQEMERNYVEALRQRAAEKEIPKDDVTDEMQNRAYRALMAPEAPESLFLPHPTELEDKLPASIRRRLRTGLALINPKGPQWGTILERLEQAGGLEGMGQYDVNGMLMCMGVAQRAEQSTKVREMMEVAGIEPNIFTFDMIMLAQASVGNSAQVKALFQECINRGLKPTVYTYGHLLKTYAQDADVASAAAAFSQMQASGVEPNLIVYTSLIQTCINRRDFETAWQIFNLMKLKSTATAPDVQTYSLMIHACAVNGEAERAMDLFTDMTVRKEMTPTAETYHALIHACAVRKDYFLDAWKYASEMQNAGMKLDNMTFNVLVQACGRVGDLTRARLLVRHMNESGNEDLRPNKTTFQNLLRAYATYKTKASWHHTMKSPAKTQKALRNAEAAKQTTIEMDQATFITPKQNLSRRQDRDIIAAKIPFLPQAILKNPRDVIDEAALVVNWLRDRKPSFVDTQIMNAYLDICKSQNSFADLEWSYNNDFKNPPNPLLYNQSQQKRKTYSQCEAQTARTEEYDLPRIQRNIYTFQSALGAAVKFRKLEFARAVWKDRQAYTVTPAYRRCSIWERQKCDFEAERCMIWSLALGNQLNEAWERISILEREGGVEWKWEDLDAVYARAVQLENSRIASDIRHITGRKYHDEMGGEGAGDGV